MSDEGTQRLLLRTVANQRNAAEPSIDEPQNSRSMLASPDCVVALRAYSLVGSGRDLLNILRELWRGVGGLGINIDVLVRLHLLLLQMPDLLHQRATVLVCNECRLHGVACRFKCALPKGSASRTASSTRMARTCKFCFDLCAARAC